MIITRYYNDQCNGLCSKRGINFHSSGIMADMKLAIPGILIIVQTSMSEKKIRFMHNLDTGLLFAYSTEAYIQFYRLQHI